MKLWKPLWDIMITSSNGAIPTMRGEMAKLVSTLFYVHFLPLKRKEQLDQLYSKKRKENPAETTLNQSQAGPSISSNSAKRGHGGTCGRGRGRGRGCGSYRNTKPYTLGANTISTTNNGNSTDAATTGVCFLCGDKDHWANDCP